MTAFTAVVVTWNSEHEIPELVASIERHLGERCRFVFVDNDSSDDTATVIADRSPSSRLIQLAENVGFGPANNIGVRAAESDVVVLLNPDTVMIDDSLADLAAVALGTPGLFAPRLLNEDRTPQISAFPPVAGWEVGLMAIWPGFLVPRRLRIRCEPWRYEEPLPAGWISGACIAARRDLLLELGPFDPSLLLYGEDIDLCIRARERGVSVVSTPDTARIVHIGSRSATRAFADVGMQRKIDARRLIVRERMGPRRAVYDTATQLLLVATRSLAKAVVRRDATADRRALRALLRTLRPGRRLEIEALDSEFRT